MSGNFLFFLLVALMLTLNYSWFLSITLNNTDVKGFF